jgi:hypothetical protein
MCAGVGLFGTFSGFLAAWFVAPGGAEEDRELRELRDEVAALRASVDALCANAGPDAAQRAVATDPTA